MRGSDFGMSTPGGQVMKNLSYGVKMIVAILDSDLRGRRGKKKSRIMSAPYPFLSNDDCCKKVH